MEGRLTLEFVSHSGISQTTVFSFIDDKMGTVSEDSGGKPVGLFRQTDQGLEIQYEDGQSVSLFANVADGLTMVRPGSSGEKICVSWYPKDHVFSVEERRAAVAAYAQSLGVSKPMTPRVSRKRAHRLPATSLSSLCSPAIAVAKQNAFGPKLTAHLVEGPATPPPFQRTHLSAKSMLTATQPTASPEVVPPGAGASQCLTVEAIGGFIGFINRCGNEVQVTYCLQNDGDPSVKCSSGRKSGSVAAAGFTGVFADNGATEHDVRWIGCSGSPGEVTPEFIRSDPPAGRCVKKSP
jgi:hypothetical protein